MLTGLADLISRRPRRVLALVLAFTVAAGVIGGPVPGKLVDSTTSFQDPSSQSVHARRLLERSTGTSDAPDVVLLIRNATPARIAAARAVLKRDRDVAAISPAVRSRDGRSAYVAATFFAGEADAGPVIDAVSRLHGVLAGGPAVASKEISSTVKKDLARAELYAFPLLFCGLTVAAALASLCVFPLRFLYSMGVSGAIAALIAVAVSLVGLSALLAVLGPRVNALAPARLRRAAERSARPDSHGRWYRLSREVMKRPAPIAAASAALLIALGIPFLGIRFTGVDASSLPPSASARQVDEAIRTEFPPAPTSPIVVAVRAPAGAAPQLSGYAYRLRALDGAAFVTRPAPAGAGLWRLDVIPRDRPLSSSAKQLVREVRAEPTPFPRLVGGQTAAFL